MDIARRRARNYAMSQGELVLMVGSRAVCQANCSGIGYKSAKFAININGELADAAARSWRPCTSPSAAMDRS